MSPDIEESAQFLLGHETPDNFVLGEKGFEILALFPNPHRIPLDHPISLFPRKAFLRQMEKD
jgi:hypothetical protein